MWAKMIIQAVKIALQVLAGVGVGKIADKIAPDKVPTYPTKGVHEPGFNVPKIAWLIGTMVLGALILKMIGRRLKIQILK